MEMCSMAGTCIALSYVALKQYCLRLLYSGIKSERLDFSGVLSGICRN